MLVASAYDRTRGFGHLRSRVLPTHGTTPQFLDGRVPGRVSQTADPKAVGSIGTAKSACIRASMDRARVAIRSVTRRSRNRCPARRQPGARPQNLRPLEQLRRCAFRSGCVLRRGSSFYATPSLMGMTLASVARSAKFRMSASSASWIGLGRTKQFSLSKSAASSAS